jgi:uncharacterized protein (DUF1778 family)
MTAAVRKARPASDRASKTEVIQIRASAEAKALINRAATLRGQKLSEFMLDSARREAEGALLDQRVFFLESDTFEAFAALLDAPATSNPALQALMSRRAPWES